MRPTKGELELARSSVRIARRRIREYHAGGDLVLVTDFLLRNDALLRRALELLGDEDIEPSL